MARHLTRQTKTNAKEKIATWARGDALPESHFITKDDLLPIKKKKDPVPKAQKRKSKRKPRPPPLPSPPAETDMSVLGPFNTKEEAEKAHDEAYLAYMEAVVKALPGTPEKFADPDFEALMDSLGPRTPVPLAPYPADEIPTLWDISRAWVNGQYPAWAAEHMMRVAQELRKDHE